MRPCSESLLMHQPSPTSRLRCQGQVRPSSLDKASVMGARGAPQKALRAAGAATVAPWAPSPVSSSSSYSDSRRSEALAALLALKIMARRPSARRRRNR